ncbi:proline-serine-threonine phosphatase-interacting protein 1-like isoform X2 [Tubulanus polymorphus]|uniref:proline-serine-threonine phosphatase-interacting protein 1-like isoform X2 n=1 Tax=Tubulanus polymorphus TaxID=672921 RepID=UPI003DA41255
MASLHCTRLVDSFWGTDFCSTAGIEALSTRLKDGNKTLKDFEDYLKQRKKIEDEYAKSMMKLVGSMGGKQELGTLRNSWEALKDCLEDIAHCHFEIEKALDEEISRVNKLAERQRTERQSEEDKVGKAHNKKKALHKKTLMAKKQYEIKCKEADTAERNANMLRQSSSTQKKELDKANVKEQKSKQQAKQCDETYAKSIQHLEVARQTWEVDMEYACEAFQKIEEERIMFLRNEIWAHTNICSQMCVMLDNDYEKVRISLESCIIQDDISEFIQKSMTGTDRPAPVIYESYHHAATSKTQRKLSASGQISAFSNRPLDHYNHDEGADDYSDKEFDDD